MNIIDSIKAFFTKDSVKMFLNLGLKLLKLILGNIAHNVALIAQEEVLNAELSGKTGEAKYEMAFKAVKSRLPEVKDSAINLAIELAVNALIKSQQ